MGKEIGDRLNVIEPAKTTESLPLIIKRYDFLDTLSSFIHSSNPNDQFQIQGPNVNDNFL